MTFYSIRNNKKKFYTLIISSIFIFFISVFFIIKSPTLTSNLAQELKIISCQPFFTDGYGEKAITKMGPKKKIESIFSGVINFLKNGCNVETLSIDISFKDLEIIKDDRSNAIKNSINLKPRKVPVILKWKNKEYRASARLKGDLQTHWTSAQQWSLKIVLKKGESIEGFREFAITKPYERRFPTNQIIAKSLERFEIITPKFIPMKVNLNGKNWGLMLAEEQFSNAYLELRELKDSPIVKLTNQEDFQIEQFLLANNFPLKKETDENAIDSLYKWRGKLEVEVYNKKNFLQNSKYTDLISLARSLNEGVVFDQLSAEELEKFIDVRKFATVVASSFIWGDVHSLLDDNSRYYLNPYSSKLEPIPTDHLYNQVDYNGVSKPLIDGINDDKDGIAIYYKLFKLKSFQEEYLIALEGVSSSFTNIEKDFNKICESYEKRCLATINLVEVRKNIDFLLKLKTKIFDDIVNDTSLQNSLEIKKENSELKKIFKKFYFLENNIYARIFSDGELVLYNLTPFNIKVKKISANTSDYITNIILEPSNVNRITKKKYFLSDTFMKETKMTLLVELFNETKTLELLVENSDFKISSLTNKSKIFSNHIKLKEKTYIFDRGKWIIDEPLILPKGYNLKIMPNTELAFTENSYIYINEGYLSSVGTKNNPIILKPNNKFWGGIFVSESKNQKSEIKYTKIIGTNFFKHKAINLTGGVNFYRSNVEIIKTEIVNSHAEDALNLVQSNFIINHSLFANHNSDAIDSDFSDGKIINVLFDNIGNDAVDTSGSRVLILKSNFNNVNDKAISAGESSNLILDNLNIDNSKFGIASKDGSTVNATNININNSQLFDVLAYQKKSFYNGGTINIKDSKLDNNKILIQNNSVAFINKKKISTVKFNAKKNLY